jgi:phosphate transport system substrate-binding protein
MTVRGFGSDLTVASNDTDEGREKNRRVEIWLKK